VICVVLGSLSMQPVATCVCIAICTRGSFPQIHVACTASECLSGLDYECNNTCNGTLEDSDATDIMCSIELVQLCGCM